ncbi:hypothetical protein H920_12054 [Fukomys damarensis]|uniref:Uncharacterized protein n=1 Tax=Fukomys damarensis TaxID=885580 RepID=A0A091D7S9_FUKDA|nr:hypothetical protein H920_12054 [Fukomys damarensis]
MGINTCTHSPPSDLPLCSTLDNSSEAWAHDITAVWAESLVGKDSDANRTGLAGVFNILLTEDSMEKKPLLWRGEPEIHSQNKELVTFPNKSDGPRTVYLSQPHLWNLGPPPGLAGGPLPVWGEKQGLVTSQAFQVFERMLADTCSSLPLLEHPLTWALVSLLSQVFPTPLRPMCS